MRSLWRLFPVAAIAGCMSMSFKSSESATAPDSLAFCQGLNVQSTKICGNVGVQVFSGKTAPGQGRKYRLAHKQAGKRL